MAASCITRHRVQIFDRGGQNKMFNIEDIAQVQWNREMDTVTQASINLTAASCADQTSKLDQIRSRRHEMVIFRGNERVWEGPIVQTKALGSGLQITAKDVLEYVSFTSLSKAWPSHPGYLMVDRIHDILVYELTSDYVMMTNDGPVAVQRWENLSPPVNILPYLDIRAGTTLTTSNTEAFQMSVGAHMNNLGQSVGVNYTTVGRRIVVWDGTLSQLRTLTEKDMAGDFAVVEDGSSMHTISHTSANQQVQGEAPLVGHAANDLSYYGPWEAIATINGTQGASSSADSSGSDGDSSSAAIHASQLSALNSQARRDLYGLYPVPLTLDTQGGQILLSSTLSINQLVAGVDIPVRAIHNIKKVSQLQRLKSLTVTETADNETIKATLTAIGTVTA